MKSKVLLILSLILVAASVVSAQKAKKTITNFDLEKYRIQREKNEADYRENYAKRGMPSPEELQQREEENARQREELSRRLAAERQLNEQNQMRQQIAEQNARINYLNSVNQGLANQNNQVVYGGYPVYGNGLILNNGYYNRPRWNRPNYPARGIYTQNQPSVVVGGGMIYSVPRSSATPAPQNVYRPRPGRRF